MLKALCTVVDIRQVPVLLGICLFLLSVQSWGLAGANPQSYWIQQADGEKFELVQKGHRLMHWQETLDGRPVILKQGQWFFAQLQADNSLKSTGQLLSSSGGLQKSRAISEKPRYQGALPVYGKSASARAPAQAQNRSVLVVLVDFADVKIAAPLSELNELVFGVSNSVASYYKESSYGRLTLLPAEESSGTINDGFIHISVATNHPSPGSDDARSLAKTLTELTANLVNFGLYDDVASGRGNGDQKLSPQELAIVFVLAGYEASFSGAPPVPNVWGHVDYFAPGSEPVVDAMKVGAYTMFGERHGTSFDFHTATKGIICHELGHLIFNLPDLYDRVGSTEGNGVWALMSSGSWNMLPGADAGSLPAQLLGWSKARAGFIDIQDVTAAAAIALQNASVSEDVKRLWIDPYRHFEYFLLENRQQQGLDGALPGSGMLITHIDERQIDGVNDDASHKLVDIEESHNGFLDSAETPFGGAARQFNSQSVPNSRGYDGVANGIDIDNISAASDSPMTMDVSPELAAGRSVGYFQGDLFASIFSADSLWSAVRVSNDLAVDFFDGIDIYAFDVGQVDIYLAATLSDAMISNWQYFETGFSLQPGWNRLLLLNRQAFAQGGERFIVIKVSGVTVSLATDIDNGAVNRSFVGSVPGALSINDGELVQQFLFSGAQPSPSNIPLISGQVDLEINEDSSLLLSLNQITVIDGDSVSGDFVLTVLGGTNYQVAGDRITPSADFNGDLMIEIKVGDGVNTSASFFLKVTVTPLNDAPVINGVKAGADFSVVQGQSLAVFLNDFDIVDPEGDPVLQLILLAGENYSVASNVVTPNPGFLGELAVPVKVSDGEDTSAAFLISVQVSADSSSGESLPDPVPVVQKRGDSSTGAVLYLLLLLLLLRLKVGKRQY